MNTQIESKTETVSHTPGPWEIGMRMPGSKRMAPAHTVGEVGIGMGVAYVFADDPEQREANARLIAAAPTMLQALKDLTAQIHLNRLNVRKDFSLMNAHAAATKAIFQAEAANP